MTNTWIYRVGVSLKELNESLGTELAESKAMKMLDKAHLVFEYVEIESALKDHIKETLDKPYKYHTSMREDAPNFFSCSSIISYLYIFAGVWMPSRVIEKFPFTKPISKEELRFGDVIYSFNDDTEDKQSPNHMGMYLGEGKVLQAAGYWYKGKVIIEDLDVSPSFKNIVGYGRVADDLKEKRFVIHVPDERPELRKKENLINEIGNYATD
jgi:hypothetical protein